MTCSKGIRKILRASFFMFSIFAYHRPSACFCVCFLSVCVWISPASSCYQRHYQAESKINKFQVKSGIKNIFTEPLDHAKVIKAVKTKVLLDWFKLKCFFLYPLQTVFVGGYTVFTLSVHPSVRASVRPKRFVFLISLRVMDGISSNLAYTFISTGQIIIIKSKDEGPFLWELFPFVILRGLCIYINRIFYITWRVIDRISSNLTHTFIFIWHVLIAKKEGLGAYPMRVISLCDS